MSQPKVRQLTQDDWRIFSILRLQALKECPGMFGSKYEDEIKSTPEDWKHWLGYTDGAVFGLFDDKKMVGITAVRNDKTQVATGFMIASYIQPEYRGRGLSDILNKARIGWAKGYMLWKKLVTSHRDGNEASRRAQQKQGFVITHRVSKTWPNGVTCDDVYCEIDLEKLRKDA